MANNANILGSLKHKFNFKPVTASLGHASRTGSESAAKMTQLDLDGNPLSGVSEQVAKLDFDKGFAKHRAAYVQGLGFCVAVKNEPTDLTMTVNMPLTMKKVEDFKTAVEKFPKSIVAKGTNNMFPDFELVKHDDKGNLIAAAVENNGTWSLAKYNMPVYKQRITDQGEPITKVTVRGEERVGVKEDENGFYLETSSEYTHVALAGITIVPGFAVSASGTKIQGTDGLYLINGDRTSAQFQTVTPGASAAKFSIKSLTKLLTHPSYGIATSSDLTGQGVLKQGSCKIDTKEYTIHVYNSNNEVDKEYSKAISDRPAFRLGDYKAKGTRASSLEEVVATEAKATKKEAAKIVLNVNDDDSIF